MPKAAFFQNNFNTGQISQAVEERHDYEKRASALREATNVLFKPAGGAFKRWGTAFRHRSSITPASGDSIRLIPFIPSRIESFIIEVGHLYMRFIPNDVTLGAPVQIAAPWLGTEVDDIDYAQNDDIMVLVHENHPPQVLARWSTTLWTLRELVFEPEPTEPQDFEPAGVQVVVTNLANNRVRLTANANIFNRTDVGRTFIAKAPFNAGQAVIDKFVSFNILEASVIRPFSATVLSDLPNGDLAWALKSAPLNHLSIVKTDTGKEADGSRGERVALVAYTEADDTIAVVSDAEFDQGNVYWTPLSPRVFLETTYIPGGPSQTFSGDVDLTAAGIEPGHRIVNVTQGASEGEISIIKNDNARATVPNNQVDTTGDVMPNWSTNDVARFTDSSHVVFANGTVELIPGANGVAAVESQISLGPRSVYKLEIEVVAGVASVTIGRSAGESDIFEAESFNVGKHTRYFTTEIDGVGTGARIRLYNDQYNTRSKVETLRVSEQNAFPFIANNVLPGDYIRLNDGYVQVLTVTSTRSLDGVVTVPLTDTQNVLPGAWTIERSAWTDKFPHAVAFYQERLILAFSLSIGGTVTSTYTTFQLGSNATDAFIFKPGSQQINPVHWLTGGENLIMGTRREEYIVRGTQTGTVTPSDIDVSAPTSIGSEPIKPLRTPEALLFVQAGGRRMIEWRYENSQAGQRDLTILSDDLMAEGEVFTSITWQDNPERIAWCASNLGNLYSLQYIRNQDIWSWAKHNVSGTVKHVQAVPGAVFDSVWLLIDRDPGFPWFLEELQSTTGIGGGPLQLDMTIYVDTNTTGLSVDGLTLNNTILDNFTTKTIYAVDSKGFHGPYVVTGPIITFTRAITEPTHLGLLITPTITTLRPSIQGQSPMSRKIGHTNTWIRILNTGEGLQVNDRAVVIRTPADAGGSKAARRTGDYQIGSLGHSRDGTFTITMTTPEPMHILAIAGSIYVED